MFPFLMFPYSMLTALSLFLMFAETKFHAWGCSSGSVFLVDFIQLQNSSIYHTKQNVRLEQRCPTKLFHVATIEKNKPYSTEAFHRYFPMETSSGKASYRQILKASCHMWRMVTGLDNAGLETSVRSKHILLEFSCKTS